MYTCRCGRLYDHHSHILGCEKAAHYGLPSIIYGNPVVPQPGQNEDGYSTTHVIHGNPVVVPSVRNSRFQSNPNSNILMVLLDHQKVLLELTQKLMSSSISKEDWSTFVITETNLMINQVQQI